MHYFIDGYNLLFRIKQAKDDLQNQRESIIYDLNQKIALVKLDVSIVFDSTYQVGDRSRTHFNHLEILFSAHGETADEYILDELKNASHPRQETVVTSDKALAWKARHFLAHTESVEDFMFRLNKTYKSKLKQPVKPSKIETKPVPKPPVVTQQKSLILPSDAPLEAYQDYYERIFEAEWEILKKEEVERKEIARSTSSKPPPRKPRKKHVDPFQAPELPEPAASTNMERWLKIFERRILEE